MQTPTHVLIAAAAFARPGAAGVNRAALLGGFAPDAFLFAVWGWSQLAGVAPSRLWNEIYWSGPVSLGQAVSNSFPLFIVGLALSVALKSRLGLAFCGAALLHLVADFLLHAEDAHAHFWPLTGWRFKSPVSYWDPAYFGRTVAFVESVVGVSLAVLLFRRFRNRLARLALGVAVLTYLAVPLYFVFSLK